MPNRADIIVKENSVAVPRPDHPYCVYALPHGMSRYHAASRIVVLRSAGFTTVVRFTNRNGVGLLNNQTLDRDKLTDDEESELVDVMDFGLQQPRDVPGGSVFAFTVEGEKEHARLIELLAKASNNGVVRTEIRFEGKPVWESDDGQVAISPSQILSDI